MKYAPMKKLLAAFALSSAFLTANLYITEQTARQQFRAKNIKTLSERIALESDSFPDREERKKYAVIISGDNEAKYRKITDSIHGDFLRLGFNPEDIYVLGASYSGAYHWGIDGLATNENIKNYSHIYHTG